MTGFICLQSKGLLRVFSNTTGPKHQFFSTRPSLWANSQIHTWILEKQKTIALNIQTHVDKVMSLLFNTLSRFLTAFLPRSKCLLCSWLQPPSAVILEPRKIKSVTVTIVSLCICHEGVGLDAMILVFSMMSLSQLFHFLHSSILGLPLWLSW